MLQIAKPWIRVADGVVEPVVVGESDHVVVQRADDAIAARDCLTNVFSASKESRLFTGEPQELDGGRHRVVAQDSRGFEQRRRARRIVVGPGSGLYRVVVAADDVLELGVRGARERGDDVGGAYWRTASADGRLEVLILRRVAE